MPAQVYDLFGDVDDCQPDLLSERPEPPASVVTSPQSVPAGTRQPCEKRTHEQRGTLAELSKCQDFLNDLQRIAQCLDEELRRALEIGRIAAKWIEGQKYHRVLNPARFAELLKQHTGIERDRKAIEGYIIAFKEHEFHDQSGKRFPHLGVTHLAQIGRSRCQTDEDRLALAERANAQKATVRQIRHLAQRLHAEAEHRRRTVALEFTHCHVRQVDGLDLLREQLPRSVHCLLLDWQWSRVSWGGHADYPAVHLPVDPVDHLCKCLAAAGTALADTGIAFLFHTSVGLLDRRIEEAWQAAGLKHAGQVIWQKTCGALMDASTPLAVAHEHAHLLCRTDVTPKSACGYVGSVTPKWAAPTNAHSGQQKEAAHPHQKPIALMELLISVATVNGLVIDPFAGSGSAGVAAMRRGCSYTGAEMVPEYVAIANRRIAMARGTANEVEEAASFFLSGATGEQRQAITGTLAKAGIRLTDNREEAQ